VHQQQLGLEAFGQRQQGEFLQLGRIRFADADSSRCVPRVVILPFGRACSRDAGGEDVGLGIETHLGLEATETPPVYGNPVGVHVMVFCEVFDAVNDIFDLRFADPVEVCLFEEPAVTGVAARVDRARDIAVLLGHVVGEEVCRRLIRTLHYTLACS